MNKKAPLFLLIGMLALSSCSSYDRASSAYMGASLGGMFGSALGGLLGGPRGSDLGTLIGGGIGMAAAAAASESSSKEAIPVVERRSSEPEPTYYNAEANFIAAEGHYATTNAAMLEVSNINFDDDNHNRTLEAGERATLTFDIYNRGGSTAYNVAPIVTANYKRIVISPTTVVGDILPGRGVRYRAQVLAKRNAKDNFVTFSIAFPDGGSVVQTAKTFNIKLVD